MLRGNNRIILVGKNGLYMNARANLRAFLGVPEGTPEFITESRPTEEEI